MASNFHSQSPGITYWSAKHLMITSCPKRMTIMIGYEQVVSPVAIFPSVIKTHHIPSHIMQWYDISFCMAHNGIKTSISTCQKSTRGHRRGIFTNSMLPTRCYATMAKKFMHKVPGSCNGSDEPTGWPPRCPDITPPNFSCGVTWRTPSSLLFLHSSFHKTRNTGQNLLPNNLTIMKSEHMNLDTFHLKLAYTYVHTHILQMKEVLKLRQWICLKLLKMTKIK